MAALIDARVRRRSLVPAVVDGLDKLAFVMPSAAAIPPGPDPETVHVLSPFDPLVILRRRLQALFGFEYRFEAYVPREKRVLGYFALPILAGDRIVAAIDIKADRRARALAIQQWTWTDAAGPGLKPQIEAALDRFERFQLGD
jgi:uncharacterized protein YcaQ